jgi:ornithine cyclodeaminase
MPQTATLLNAQQTATALPYPPLAAEIGATLRDWRAGQVQALERATAPLPGDGTFLLMGAADQRLAIAKVGAVHPGNAARGLPTIIASVLITDAVTGQVSAIVDGNTVTVHRTAALSLYGAQQAGAKADTTFLVGAGAQALGHVHALHAGLGIRRLLVASRSPSRVQALVQHARSMGIQAEAVDGAERAAEADTIVTATNSSWPVLPAGLAQRLKPHATILAVGAFRPDMAELPPELVAACDVLVDTLEGARAEAGDLIQAERLGAWSWDRATQLADALDGFNRSGRPVLFKSVGHSMWDLAAARLLTPEE